jgi:asparagine synthase (glutamine-hydrolysing)
MCGIAGILTVQPDLTLTSALEAMRDALGHRGPDDAGLAEIALPGGTRLGLAHTRLAILDISPAGHQPMADPESGSWIVYNGEVYNHQDLRRQMPDCPFQGGSDTETVLKAWARRGEAIMAGLRGMFAFGLYDGRRRQFWLVRDRLGIKPLYVAQAGPDTWVFASEIRALLDSGLVAGRLRAAAVRAYLAFGAVPDPWTLVEGVQSLLAGEAWRFDLDRGGGRLSAERIRYWRPAFGPAAGPEPARQEAVEQLRPVLREAVSLRMLADVPVGVFLSGGIDSSAVVAVLASQGHRLRTFAVTFGERRYDESAHARQVARRFATEHTELLLRPGQVLEEFDRALGAYDQPSIDGFNTYFIAQATRQAGVKVALSGLGGDELFAGYPYFRYLARLEHPARRGLARLLHGLLRRLRPQGMRTQKLGALLAGNGSRLASHAVCRQVMLPGRRQALLGQAEEGELPLDAEVAEGLEAAAAGLDAVNAHSLLELALYLGNMLLRDTDQMSMAHSLEVREPLLDHELVDTVARLPGALKLAPSRHGRVKGLLLDALPAPLPDEVVRRPKMGFIFPWEHWLRQELRGRVTDTLAERDVLEAAGLDPAGARALWEGYLAGRPGLRYTDVLCLVNLLAWVKRHGLEQRRASIPLGQASGTLALRR